MMSDSKFDFDEFIHSELQDTDFFPASKPVGDPSADSNTKTDMNDRGELDKDNNKNFHPDIDSDPDDEPSGETIDDTPDKYYSDVSPQKSVKSNDDFHDSDYSDDGKDKSSHSLLNDSNMQGEEDGSTNNTGQEKHYDRSPSLSPPPSRKSNRVSSARINSSLLDDSNVQDEEDMNNTEKMRDDVGSPSPSPPPSRKSNRANSARMSKSPSPSPGRNEQSRSPSPLHNGKQSRSPSPSPRKDVEYRSPSPSPRQNIESRSPSPSPRKDIESRSPSPLESRSPSPVVQNNIRSPSPHRDVSSDESDKEYEPVSRSPPRQSEYYSPAQSRNSHKSILSNSQSSSLSKKNRRISYDTSDREEEGDSPNDQYSMVSEAPRQKPKPKNNLTSNKRARSQPNPRPPIGPPPRRYSQQQPKKGRGGNSVRGANTRNMNRTNEEKSEVVNRVLSANRNKARALHNVITELQHQIEGLTIENKDLRRAARLQDREIKKLDNAEAELPSLLKKHSSETRVLQERFRKQKEQSDKAREELKKREVELYKTKEKLHKYEGLVKEKNLAERKTLNKKLEQLEYSLEEKDKKISELARSVQLHEKVRARELKEKNEKYRRAVDEMKRLEQEQKELLRKLRDKEKALEVTNIYSQRLNQRRGSKETDRSGFLFSPRDPVAPVIKRHQEEQETEYAHSVIAQSTKKAFLTEKDTISSERRPGKMITMDFEGDNDSVRTSPRYNNKSPKSKQKSNDSPKLIKTLVSETKEDLTDGEDGDEFYDNKKKEDQDRLEELDRRIAELKRREEMERREEEKRKLQAEKELEERIARLEAERLRNEEEERDRKEQEEKRRLEDERQRQEAAQEILQQQHAEQERQKDLINQRRVEEEDNKNAEESKTDQQREDEQFEIKKREMLEKRRKKELLLAKMQEIDRGENPEQLSKLPEDKPKKKPIFLESNNSPKHEKSARDPLDLSSDSIKSNNSAKRNRRNEDPFSANSGRKNSWEFKRTDENLHRGLPSHSDENSPVLRRRSTKDSDGLLSTSSSGHSRRPRNDELSTSDTKSRRHDNFTEHNDTGYSPTGLKEQPVSLKKNKKTDDLFGAFEDPFKSTKSNLPNGGTTKKTNDPFGQYEDPFSSKKTTNNNNRNKNTLIFSSDEDDGVDDIPTYQPSKVTNKPKREFKGANNFQPRSSVKSSHAFGDDDLEEMIL